MKTELLAPAGSLECFYMAIYNGANAVYLALDRFGARAYAKNFTFNELKNALIYAKTKNVKIYVTVNTMIKEDELQASKEYLYELYKIGVDGIIVTDFALINYINNYLKPMECHISTQSGVKDLNDVLFFENLGVDRCVLAREVSIDKIKQIKQASKMPLEVFAYGALCVSYSGGCLFSSLLSLRSGNRGRCSQNCRREFKLYKNNELIDSGFLLSMRDLNTFNNLDELTKIGVDSLKIEGRMKGPDYVKVITSEFRNKLDDKNYKANKLESVFHRPYTKGFLFNEDKSEIVDKNKRKNEGKYIGYIQGIVGDYTKIKLEANLSINDKIRVDDEYDEYYKINEILDLNKKKINSSNGTILLKLYKKHENNTKIYKVTDSTISLDINPNDKYPLDIKVYANLDNNLILSTTIDNNYIEAKSDMILVNAKNQGLDYNTLFKQISKLNDTPYYLSNLECYIDDNLFITVSEINKARRNLIENVNSYFSNIRKDIKIIDEINVNYDYEYDDEIVCHVINDEQYRACKELGIKTIYYKNYSPYVNAKYQEINDDYLLIGSYGGLKHYNNKILTADYSFNILNSESIRYMQKYAKYITLSLECDNKLLADIYNSYLNKYKKEPPIEFVVYGYQNLMTTAFCPLKKLGQCGQCNKNKYELRDNNGKFYIYHDECITHIINGKSLNLIDELDYIKKYAKRLRLNFTIESYEETLNILKDFINKYNGIDNDKKFDSNKNTRGYFKRPIL